MRGHALGNHCRREAFPTCAVELKSENGREAATARALVPNALYKKGRTDDPTADHSLARALPQRDRMRRPLRRAVFRERRFQCSET
jgi:hypothetical protein